MRPITRVSLLVGAVLACAVTVVGGLVAVSRFAGMMSKYEAPRPGAPPQTTVPLDESERVIDLSFPPRHLASSGDFLCVQDPLNSRVAVFNWRRLDDKCLRIPVLTAYDSAVAGDGSILNSPYFEKWSEDKPLSPADARARKLEVEVIKAEPYLQEFAKTKGNLIIRRKADRAEAEIVENLGRSWYVEKIKPAQGGRSVGICLLEDYVVTGGDPFARKLRIGSYKVAAKKLAWVDGLRADPDKDHRPCVNSVAISNDGTMVAVVGSNGQGGWVACVDVGKQAVLWEKGYDKNADTSAFQDGDFSPDGKKFYAGGTHGELYAYEARTGKYLSVCAVRSRIERVVPSPDGKKVAAGLANGDGTVCLIDAKTGKLVRNITTGLNVIRGIGFSPDSQLLVAAGAGSWKIKFYRVGSRAPAKPIVPRKE